VNWDDLRFVLAVARHGTLTRAAKELGVNHTTVSRRLSGLQDDLGVRLFDRTPSGFHATHEARELLSVVERMEEAVQSLDRALLGKDARLVGSVRVTTVDVMALEHMRDIREFNASFPDVTVELSVDNEPRSLARREADVAIRVSNSPPEYLVGRRVGVFRYAVFAHRDLYEQHGDDLAAYPWVCWDERVRALMTEEWMKEHVPGARRTLHVDSATVMNAAIRSGLGAAHLPLSFAAPHPELVQIGDVIDSFSMDLWILTHPDLRDTARVRAFTDFMSERLRARHG